MANRIKIEDLMLRELDRSLEMKSGFETKAVGYLTVLALTISSLLEFKIKGSLESFLLLSNWDKINFIFYICTFLFGLFVLVICSLMLYPRKILFFDSDKLKQLYDLQQQNDGEFDKAILIKTTEFIQVNNKAVDRLKELNQLASLGLIITISSFIVCAIFFLF